MAHGMHFFMNPGPTNIPDRILRAMDRGAIDFTGAQFRAISEECFAGLKRVFKTEETILAYAATGHGAWEAALVNLFSPGDKVLVVESGFFSLNWGMRGEAFGLEVETLPNDWRRPADPARLEARLREDREHKIKAVLAGALRDLDRRRQPGRRAAPRDRRGAASRALPRRHDLLARLDGFPHRRMGRRCRRRRLAEGADAADRHGLYRGQRQGARRRRDGQIAAGLLGLEAPHRRGLARPIWNGTAPVHFFYGMQEALRMLEEEGLDNVFARHHRLAEATRRAVRAWRQNDGPEVYAIEPGAQSNTVTAVLVPEGYDADQVRQTALDKFNVSLGGGLDRLKGRVFRIGHLGDLNEPMVLGTIAAVEMALDLTGVPHGKGGVQAAMEYLAGEA